MSSFDSSSQRSRGPAPSVLPSTTTSGTTRAEKFEDERRRFIESCFSKKDTDGLLIESYITHIRIIEDAGYPTSPPPPSSAPENKKSRVIVVAVRKSGRLRLHKARENANGTFSIGKTWLLEDLTAIQTYGSVTPSNELEQQHMEWAGNEGFLVTIGKPYYWQAITAKEKDFFIQSLTRIYKKYTGGKIPELIGFDEGERQTLIGSSLPLTQPRGLPSRQERQEKPDDSVPPRPGSNPGKPPPSRNRPPSRERSREQGPPYQNRAPSREGNRENGGPQARTYNGPPSRDGYLDQRQQQQIPPYERAPSRNGSREPLRRPSEEAFLRKQASREQMQRAPGPFIPPRTRQDLTPQSSHSQLSREQTSSPVNTRNVPNGFSQTPPPPSRSDASSARFGAAPSTESLDTPISDSLPKVTAIEPNRLPTNKAIDSVAKDGPAPQRPGSPLVDENRRVMKPESASASDTKQDSLPDRRRPPFQGPAVSFGQRSTHSDTNDNFSTPLTTPSTRDGDGRAPSRSSDRPNPSAVQTKPAEYFPPPQTEDARSTDLTSGTTAVKHEDISQKTGPSDSLASVHDALSAPTPFPDTSTPPTESKQEESFRPGLGPMMKKKSTKDIAKTLRMAATAYNAFKPRAGGAAERFFAEKEKLTGEPDGITGVVPAPIQRGISNETSRSATPDSASNRPLSATGKERPFSPLGVSFKQEPPKVQITRTATDNGQSLTELPQTQSESPGKSRSKSPGGAQSDRRRKRKSESSTKYLTALGLDPAILEGHSTEFDGVLTELAWNGRLPDEKSIDELEVDVRREIGRVQAGSWLGHMEQQEGKIEQLSRMFDRCMEECEELDGLLTLYAHELNTLNDDIAYIEAQSQGLQVQTANQKLLQTELQNLLGTLSISSSQLLPLKEGSLATPEGVERVESSLSTLYEAMIKIDPTMRQKRTLEGPSTAPDEGKLGGATDREVGSMRAVRERKDVYHDESLLFVQRLRQYMSKAFKNAARRTVESVEQSQKQLRPQSYKVDPAIHNAGRQEIWLYSPLMLFTRDVDTIEWEGIIRSYEQSIKIVYQDEFRDDIAAWTRTAKKPLGDEQDALFTAQEKEAEGITTAARKLTVKRGKTVRVAGAVRQLSAEKQGGKVEPFEAFAGALEEMATLISQEQNFITHFFHASSHSNIDFVDAISAARPQNRSLPRLTSNQTYEPDREMAKRVSQTLEEIYPSWATDVQNLAGWALKPDQLQVVGVLGALERTLAQFEETNQEFLVRTLQKIHASQGAHFTRFIDEQVHGIEETKVKIKKRKGVIAFIKVFPHFSNIIEGMLPAPEPNSETLEVRYTVNDAYGKINKAMWESLKFIAKESPAGGQTGGGADPEDKEALNYHILLIENMNHYLEEVDGRDNIVLEEWRDRATHDMAEHLKLYLDAVIRRPLGKLLDFVESVETLLPTVSPPSDIATKASHSQSTAKKVYGMFDSKEIRRGVDALKKRVEKHFGDADDPGLSRSLVSKVLRELESRYERMWERATRISEIVYSSEVQIGWSQDELKQAFRR